MRAEGYYVHVQKLNADRFGEPQRRPRLYFICLHDPSGNLDPQTLAESMQHLFAALEVAPAPLSGYLLPLDHPDLAAWMGAHPRSQGGPDAGLAAGKWVEEHKKAFTGAGWEHPPNVKLLEDLGMEAEVFQALTPREREVLFFHLFVKPAQRPQGAICALDVYQSLGRVPKAIDASPCILPGSRIFLVGPGLCRLLLPIEALRLQGIVVPIRPSDYSWRELFSLAGNAFHSGSVAAAAVVLLCHWVWE